MTNPSTRQKGQACVTNSQPAGHDIWPVRCSHRDLGFSRSNQHNYIRGSEEEYWEGGIKGFFFKGRGKEGGIISKGGDKYPLRTMGINTV